MSIRRRLHHPFLFSLTTAAALACFVAALGVSLSLAATSASAQTAEEIQAQRDRWQGQYRDLLRDRLRLTANIAKSRKNYSQAQRRNYPRGGARQQFLVDVENAEKALAATEEAILEIFVAARGEGVPPGWLYEVEDETIEWVQPAAPGSDSDDEEDRAGRNPIYFDDYEES